MSFSPKPSAAAGPSATGKTAASTTYTTTTTTVYSDSIADALMAATALGSSRSTQNNNAHDHRGPLLLHTADVLEVTLHIPTTTKATTAEVGQQKGDKRPQGESAALLGDVVVALVEHATSLLADLEKQAANEKETSPSAEAVLKTTLTRLAVLVQQQQQKMDRKEQEEEETKKKKEEEEEDDAEYRLGQMIRAKMPWAVADEEPPTPESSDDES